MDIPSAVCKQLARVNPDYRYGIGVLPGRGQVAFLSILVDKQVAGSAGLVFKVGDLGERLIRLYDKDGSSPCRVPDSKVAVLIGWPGDPVKSFGNAAVIAGDHASWLEREGKPMYVVEDERREHIANNGREIDQYVADAADDLADRWLHLGAKETGRDPLFDKEDTKRLLKTPQGREWELTHNKAKENSFEAFTLEENGLKQ